MFLTIFGSASFPALFGIRAYIRNRASYFRFSLLTKITTTTYFSLFVSGLLSILTLEYNHAFKGCNRHQSLFYALFQFATTRSAELQTIDVTHLSDTTNVIINILMFIGSSPSSVGGGIRTTTFAILILSVINFNNNTKKSSVKVFSGEVHVIDIQRSFAVFMMTTALTFVSIVVILAAEVSNLSFLQVFFEVMSTSGTCGLLLRATDDTSGIVKIVLMLLMFIGRIGLISFIIMISGRKKPDKSNYPKERIQIG